MLRTRVRLDEQGLAKASGLSQDSPFAGMQSNRGTSPGEDERLLSGDSFTLQVARFRIRGRRRR